MARRLGPDLVATPQGGHHNPTGGPRGRHSLPTPRECRQAGPDRLARAGPARIDERVAFLLPPEKVIGNLLDDPTTANGLAALNAGLCAPAAIATILQLLHDTRECAAGVDDGVARVLERAYRRNTAGRRTLFTKEARAGGDAERLAALALDAYGAIDEDSGAASPVATVLALRSLLPAFKVKAGRSLIAAQEALRAEAETVEARGLGVGLLASPRHVVVAVAMEGCQGFFTVDGDGAISWGASLLQAAPSLRRGGADRRQQARVHAFVLRRARSGEDEQHPQLEGCGRLTALGVLGWNRAEVAARVLQRAARSHLQRAQDGVRGAYQGGDNAARGGAIGRRRPGEGAEAPVPCRGWCRLRSAAKQYAPVGFGSSTPPGAGRAGEVLAAGKAAPRATTEEVQASAVALGRKTRLKAARVVPRGLIM